MKTYTFTVFSPILKKTFTNKAEFRPWVLRRRPRAKNHRTPEGGWEVRDGKAILGKSDNLNTTAWENAALSIRWPNTDAQEPADDNQTQNAK